MSSCFVIMPITTPEHLLGEYSRDTAHFEHVLQYLFRPAVERLGYELIGPETSGSQVIHAEIVRHLETADLVLCDLSTLNPNVFFELGIRTALDRPVSIVRDRITLSLPFDTSLINYWTYDHELAPWTIENQVTSLYTHLLKSVNGSEGRNNMWRLFGLTVRAAPTNIGSDDSAKLDAIIDLLRATQSDVSLQAKITPRSTERAVVFVTEAQKLAATESAILTLSKINEHEIVFDASNFIISNLTRARIQELADRYGYNVTLTGGMTFEEYLKAQKVQK